jgi:hypothetical protein
MIRGQGRGSNSGDLKAVGNHPVIVESSIQTYRIYDDFMPAEIRRMIQEFPVPVSITQLFEVARSAGSWAPIAQVIPIRLAQLFPDFKPIERQYRGRPVRGEPRQVPARWRRLTPASRG